MVGLVLVSHSHDLAQATLKLIRSMSGEEIPIAIAAGIGENYKELGTDAMEIYSAIESVWSEKGVLVLMDMGSAILSTEMALDFLDISIKEKVKLCPASFVEGAIMASVTSKIGGTLDDVFREASYSLKQKEQHLQTELENFIDKNIQNNIDKISVQVKTLNPHGLHARPVANLIQIASKYPFEINIKNLSNNKGPCSIRSMTEVISLEVLKENIIELSCYDRNALYALEEISKEIESGLGDNLNVFVANEVISTENISLEPLGVSKGIAIGKPLYIEKNSFQIPDHLIDLQNTEKEINRFLDALNQSKQSILKKEKDIAEHLGKEYAEIFKAQTFILEDPSIINEVDQHIRIDKNNAAVAWWKVLQKIIEKYKGFTDPNLQQRALDIQDITITVLKELGIEVKEDIPIDKEGILIVNNITPNEVIHLNTEKIKGVICLENGATSHSSILLKSRRIPTIIQAKHFNSSLLNLDLNSLLIMDGEKGTIILNPKNEILHKYKKNQEEEEEEYSKAKILSKEPAISLDKHIITVMANVGKQEDSKKALELGAEGIGLLRTEFMFIDRKEAPSEEEQFSELYSIIAPMKGKKITIRTLDVGGDKEVPYLNIPKEENPFLGIRAIRLCLKNKDLFQKQLRAILRAGLGYEIKVMFPMISTLKELSLAKSELEKAHQSLDKEGIKHIWPVSTGIMIEVPSAAIEADSFAKEVDFMSIGTNDLIQYTLAADRGNPYIQEMMGQSINTSVIKLIEHVVNSCKKQNIPVSVCGEVATNHEWAAALLKLGIKELSMNSGSIPLMKEWIRKQNISRL